MRIMTSDEAHDKMLDIPFAANPSDRGRTSPADFDEDDVMICVKHLGVSLEQRLEPDALVFGKYIGKHGDEFIVVTRPASSFDVRGGEAFDSWEELAQRWELD